MPSLGTMFQSCTIFHIKVELNELGQIAMSRATSHHSISQGLLIDAINRLKDDRYINWFFRLANNGH
jgi:hypothetical protein